MDTNCIYFIVLILLINGTIRWTFFSVPFNEVKIEFYKPGERELERKFLELL